MRGLREAADETHRDAELQLMLMPATSHRALEWKRKTQSQFMGKDDRDKWLPVLIEDAKRLGVDPATIIEEPPPSRFAQEVAETQECFTAALRLLAAAADADPTLKARAEKLLGQFAPKSAS